MRRLNEILKANGRLWYQFLYWIGATGRCAGCARGVHPHRLRTDYPLHLALGVKPPAEWCADPKCDCAAGAR